MFNCLYAGFFFFFFWGAFFFFFFTRPLGLHAVESFGLTS